MTIEQNSNNRRGTKDRALGVNISMPQSLFNKIDALRGKKNRSAYVRDIVIPAIEAEYEEYLKTHNNST